MTVDELYNKLIKLFKAGQEQTQKLFEIEREYTRVLVREEVLASEKRIKTEFNGRITEVNVRIDKLIEHMKEYFHMTWERMDETNGRITIIEDHLNLPHSTEN